MIKLYILLGLTAYILYVRGLYKRIKKGGKYN